MHPKDVQLNEGRYDIWRDTVWINHENKKFFVPIWRNGSTTFTHEVSENYNYVLEKLKDNSYEGYTFIRDPFLRIKGQIYITCKLNNITVNEVLEILKNPGPKIDMKIRGMSLMEFYKHDFDPHLRTQYSFLQDYDIKYYINLDNPKYTGDKHIDSIIDLITIKKNKTNQLPIEIDLLEEDWRLIEETFKEDYILFKEKAE